ncbi:MAG: SsrA-binding protein SmpB [Candidatus Moraniibacteriota bacterium]|nr:MAG: SsrA-binding protein SmpB [Candidatus Moranbacteria bacterium]
MSILCENKRAFHDYTLLEKYVAGLALTGQEVKAIKNHQISLKGSFVTFSNNEAFLTNAHVSAYKNAGELPSYEPERSRKLLLKKKEISNLVEKKQTQGLTVVPIKIFISRRGLLKIEIALARGKKQFDKRADIAKRESQRRMQRISSSLN